MFFRQISDFDENFKFLDRLNILLFNVWHDKNAKAYHTQSIDQLEMFYRNYVNEMRQKSNELKALESEINELVEQLRSVVEDTRMLATDPEIRGCLLCTAYGRKPDVPDVLTHERFVMRPNEDPHYVEDFAMSRCSYLCNIESASIDEQL